MALDGKQKIVCDFSDKSLYNSAYLPLFQNTSEFLHLWGSAGSGKSVFIAQREIVETFDSTRRGRKTVVFRKFGTTLKDSCYAELLGVIDDWNLGKYFKCLKSPLSITNLLTGVEILFKGLDDVEKVKSIKGVDRAWIEEATELDQRDELEQIRLRLRGFDKVQIVLSYNPINEHHWLNTEIHQNRPLEHYLFHTTYNNNEKLLAKDPTYAPNIERYKDTNPNYYRVYGLGLWGKIIEGLIYQHYEIIDKFPQQQAADKTFFDDIHAYGLDFGFSDPAALVALHLKDALPKKKLICKEVLYKTGLDGIGLIREFEKLGVRKDIQIVADSARPELIKTLKDVGYKIRACEKFAGSVLSGINQVRKFDIEVVAGSKNLVIELNNYQKKQVQGTWQEEPAPNQVEHLADAVRYGSELFYKKDGVTIHKHKVK